MCSRCVPPAHANDRPSPGTLMMISLESPHLLSAEYAQLLNTADACSWQTVTKAMPYQMLPLFFVGAILYKDFGTMAEKMCFACLQQCLPAGGALELNVCWECAMSQ